MTIEAFKNGMGVVYEPEPNTAKTHMEAYLASPLASRKVFVGEVCG